MNPTRILIIDDEIKLTRSLAFALKQAGYECFESNNGTTGCAVARRERPDVILLDVRMPGLSGLEVLAQLKEDLPETPVIMISALGDTHDAVTAMKMGAVDYLSKPFDVDELILLIKETHARRQLESEVKYLREQMIDNAAFIGTSPVIRTLHKQMDRVAQGKVSPVMLQGELGVGKAVVAREIHLRRHGRDVPFVEMSCATVSADQIEAELFGAEKGTLPGQEFMRPGLVEIADGGTLFLHDVNEMPLGLQARFLAFLETGSYRPMGVVRTKRADVRVIVASNSDLEADVANGRFRQDLLYRLKLIPILIPPLRDRKEDIELLVFQFVQSMAKRAGLKPIRFSRSAMALLTNYRWPGNVRELKNLIERLTILFPAEIIGGAQMPLEFHNVAPHSPATIEDAVRDVELDLVRDALNNCRQRKGEAAALLGISRHALKRRMQKLGLS